MCGESLRLYMEIRPKKEKRQELSDCHIAQLEKFKTGKSLYCMLSRLVLPIRPILGFRFVVSREV
jgi:hypothetical protein